MGSRFRNAATPGFGFFLPGTATETLDRLLRRGPTYFSNQERGREGGKHRREGGRDGGVEHEASERGAAAAGSGFRQTLSRTDEVTARQRRRAKAAPRALS